AADGDAAIEVAAIDNDDLTITGADEVAVDRAVTGNVKGLNGPGDGVELNGGGAAVAIDLTRVVQGAVAGAVEDDAGPAVAADLPEVVDAGRAGGVDAAHALDDRTGAVGDLAAAGQHHGVAAADIELRPGQHVDGDVAAAGLRDDSGGHRVGLVAIA